MMSWQSHIHENKNYYIQMKRFIGIYLILEDDNGESCDSSRNLNITVACKQLIAVAVLVRNCQFRFLSLS